MLIVSIDQYFDCLMTMFNILLIFAGILEYVLLGIDFKVGVISYLDDTPLISACTGQLR